MGRVIESRKVPDIDVAGASYCQHGLSAIGDVIVMRDAPVGANYFRGLMRQDDEVVLTVTVTAMRPSLPHRIVTRVVFRGIPMAKLVLTHPGH